jgi:NADH-quinone oxidoreductase subunit H
VLTASALMATVFFGGWDIPFWTGDDAFWVDGVLLQGYTAAGAAIPAQLAWWKTALTFMAFGLKTAAFVVVYIWVRWTLPRFRYDQVMHLGWKVMLPTALGYVVIVAVTILSLDSFGVESKLVFGLVLTLVSLICTGLFMFVLDRDRIITGSIPAAARGVPVARG